MKNYIRGIIWGIVGTFIVSAGIYILAKRNSYESKIKDLQVELAHANIPMQQDTIRDSVQVITQNIIEVDKSSSKDVMEKQLIKDLKLKLKQVSSQQTTSTSIHDTVTVHVRNNCFHYKDIWAEFNLEDSMLEYSVRDSVTAIVYREYKHHFLWWRWGTKGYGIKIVNFNPHGTVLYNQYIKIN